jgi:hypothetical protein
MSLEGPGVGQPNSLVGSPGGRGSRHRRRAPPPASPKPCPRRQILGVAEYPANGMKVAHRAGGHSWAENADMSSLKGGEFPLRRKQKGFIC